MSDPIQFDLAIEFLRNKIKLPTSGWTDIWQEHHSHAFVVAGANTDALVEDFFNATYQAKWAKGGGGYEGFRKSFDETVKKHGWAHHGTPGWRSAIIYDTNISQAYHAGREKQMMDLIHIRPYGLYRHTSSEHPRLHHLAWDGLIIPLDDPWWDTHTPQNGWRCRCKKYSLTRTEAQQMWTTAGKTGPDIAPPIEMEKRIVGKTGSNPREVWVPKGIDPGFAYNPGKAWLEPHTVPPLQGYDAVLQDRGKVWPGKAPESIPLPKPFVVPANVILPAEIKPEVAVTEFLDIFGADMDKGVAFSDATGVSVAITKALFQDGSGEFKWLAKPEKIDRLRYVNMLAMTLIEPDEIWWAWEIDRAWANDNPDKHNRWRLKRRYLRAFQVEGTGEYGISVFEWGSSGWTGSTAFMAEPSSEKARLKYFDKQRVGQLVYQK